LVGPVPAFCVAQLVSTTATIAASNIIFFDTPSPDL